MNPQSSNDNGTRESRNGLCAAERDSSGIRFIDSALVDALLLEAVCLAEEARKLIESGHTSVQDAKSGVLEALLENRDASLTTTRLSHSVAWLLAAKEVLSDREDIEYLRDFDVSAIRTLSEDPYLDRDASSVGVAWSLLLKRSNEIFRWVVGLNDLIMKRSVR